MEHFYQDIPGWFDFEEVYRRMVEEAPADKPSRFVEVGSWLGKSTAFLGVEVVNSGKAIYIECVDMWEGTPGNVEHERVKTEVGNLYAAFLRNIEPIPGRPRIMRMTSLEAAALHPNELLNFVFIDAAHDEADVAADIAAWLPKVRLGGYIGGHDFSRHWPGVVKAVQTALEGKQYEVIGNSWLYRKGKEC